MGKPKKKFKEKDIGRRITYKSFNETERGRLKAYNNEKQQARVVFHANGNLGLSIEIWSKFTAQGCNYDDLIF